MREQWHIRGECLENCNCEFLCPCLLGPRNERGAPIARPTEGHCDVPLVFQIQAGAYGTVRLDNTHVGMSIFTPRLMGEGNWSVGLYLTSAPRRSNGRP